MPPPSKRILLGPVALFVVAVLLTIHLINLTIGGGHYEEGGEDGSWPWRRRRLFLAGLRASSLAGPSPRNKLPRYPYSVVIVSYHKTGHDLQMDLVDILTGEFAKSGGPTLTKYGNKSPVRRRRHKPVTPCARIHPKVGTVSVQHAPDLFCKPEELAHTLLEGGDYHVEGERGVKVVHLIRNPFSMAVSNYHYHAQVPTPEPWVQFQNPCDIEYHEAAINETYREMVVPTLSKMSYKSLGVTFGQKLLTEEEFDKVHNDCLSLYQTKPDLKDANLLSHLMNYDPPEGLRLATAEMMVQGYDNGGDILRMANNVVKLKQAQVYAEKDIDPRLELGQQGRGKELQVYTMSLDDFIENPAVSALKFFDFVLDGTDAKREDMERVAREYEQGYREKMEKSQHVTHGKSADSVELKEYLRHDGVFGPPLSKIALLVETALADSRNV